MQSKIIKTALLLSLLAGAQPAAGETVKPQQDLVYFIRPEAVRTKSCTYLLLEKCLFAGGQSNSFVILQINTGENRKELKEFNGNYRAAAALGDQLHVFHGSNYSTYEDLQFKKSHDWPFPNWSIKCAVGVDQVILVLCVEKENVGDETVGKRDTAHAATRLKLAILADGEWTSAPESSDAPSEIVGVQAGYHDGGLFVVASGKPVAGEVPIYQCLFDGKAWTDWDEIMVLPVTGQYTLAPADDEMHLLYREEVGRIREGRPLFDKIWKPNDGWMTTKDTRLREGLFGSSLSMVGCNAAGEPSVFMIATFTGEVTASVYQGGEWQPQCKVGDLPPLIGRVHPLSLLINLLLNACLMMAIGISLLLRRRRSCLSELGGKIVELASWRRRSAACLIDLMVIYFGFALAISLFPVSAVAQIEVIGSPVSLIPLFVYFVVMESLRGQTLGKMLLRIAVVNRSGKRPAFPNILVRSLLRMFEVVFLPLLGLLVLVNTKKLQRLGDLLGQTYVIRVPRNLAGKTE